MNGDDRIRLDDDLVAALTDAQAPQPVSPEVAARIKSRLLNRIADAEAPQVAIPPESGAWRSFGPGVEIKVLFKRDGIMSYLLRMAPGAELPNHRHPVEEECVVVEGFVEMGGVTMGPGGYLMERAGTLHPPLRTVDGATIYLRGASPKADHLV